MHVTRRIFGISSGVFAILVLTLVGLWVWIGRAGGTELEQWIGRYLITVVESYVHPRVSWTRLDYQAPLTVVIDEPALTQDHVSLLQLRRLTLGLSEIPRRGQPVRIERLVLDRPLLAFVSTPQGELVGWTHFVRPGVVAAPERVAPGARLSDALRMRSLTIQHGELRYDPATGDPQMLLGGIDVQLDTPPKPDDPGAYRLSGKLSREGLVEIGLEGEINLDNGVLRVDGLDVNAALDEGRYGVFPPGFQETLARHRVQGQLSAHVEGTLPLTRWQESNAQAELRLAGARLVLQQTALTLDHLNVHGRLAAGDAQVSYDAALLAGSSQGQARGRLDGAAPLELEVRFADIDLATLLAMLPPDAREKLPKLTAGPLSGTLRGALSVGDWTQSAGELTASTDELRVTLAGAALAMRQLECSAKVDAERAVLTGKAQTFGGQVDAELQTAAQQPAPLHVALRAGNLDVAELWSGMPAPVRSAAPLEQVVGRADADVKLVLDGSTHAVAEFQAESRFKDVGAQIAGRPLRLETLHVKTTQAPPDVALQFELSGLGGAARGHVGVPSATDAPAEIVAALDNIAIEQALALLPMGLADPMQSRIASGRLSGEVDVSLPRSDPSQALARLDLAFRDVALSGSDPGPRIDALRIAGTVHPEAIDLTFDGSMFQGRAAGAVRQARASPLHLDVKLEGLAAEPLLLAAGVSPLQGMLTGTLSAHVNAEIPGPGWRGSGGRAQVTLTGAELALGAYRVPIERLELDATLTDGVLLAEYRADLLGGSASGRAHLNLEQPIALQTDWSVRDALVEKIYAAAEQRSDMLAGRLQTSGSLTGELARWPASANGSGTLTVEAARLVSLPLLSDLLRHVRAAIPNIPFLTRERQDRAAFTFQIRPDRVVLESFDIECALVAARGSGDMYYDQTIDLVVNAGPLEKAQSLLGRVGDVIGQVTSRVIAYEVRGTVAQPRFAVRPLGIPLRR
jgi:hypothetical protein